MGVRVAGDVVDRPHLLTLVTSLRMQTGHALQVRTEKGCRFGGVADTAIEQL